MKSKSGSRGASLSTGRKVGVIPTKVVTNVTGKVPMKGGTRPKK